MSLPTDRDDFDRLVPSWPWSEFPKAPSALYGLIDGIIAVEQQLLLFANPSSGDVSSAHRANAVKLSHLHLRNRETLFIEYIARAHGSRKRIARQAVRELKAVVDFLNAQAALISAAYPAPAVAAAHARRGVLGIPEHIMNAAGASY